jgi:hypothetical protein
MFAYKPRFIVGFLIISTLLVSGLSALSYGMMATSQPCETCTMTVGADAQAHLKVFDSTGNIHYADCLMCAFKMLRTYGELTINVTCDWYGPNSTITIILDNYTSGNYVNSTVVNPSTALFIDGGCSKNRVVYNQTAADALIGNNGTSPYVSMMQNVTIASNPTVMTIEQAALKYAFVYSPDPTPTTTPTLTSPPIVSPTSIATPKPTPTKTPAPTATPTTTEKTTQSCEVCGMDVTPESQARYKITDGTGNVHYAECFMCAMQLINDYETLHIQTYCDWYGPSYPIKVDTSKYGATVNVSPSTAMFLRGGSCVTARAAYNQTAADNLLTNGFSQNTSLEQHYALPSTTQVKLVNDAISTWYAQADTTATPTSLMLILALVVGVVIIIGSVFAFKKLKST